MAFYRFTPSNALDYKQKKKTLSQMWVKHQVPGKLGPKQLGLVLYAYGAQGSRPLRISHEVMDIFRTGGGGGGGGGGGVQPHSIAFGGVSSPIIRVIQIRLN